jgi:hypothetical protein
MGVPKKYSLINIIVDEVLDKIDELETIMLGKEKDNPEFAWLKDKFDELRILVKALRYT